jgi:diguanylate cyclase (GGDEF)-like protein
VGLFRRSSGSDLRRFVAGEVSATWCRRFAEQGPVPRLVEDLLERVLDALDDDAPAAAETRLEHAAYAVGVLRAQQGTHTVGLVEDVLALRPLLGEAVAALPGAAGDAGLHLLLHVRLTRVLDVVLRCAVHAYVEESQQVLRGRATRDPLTGLLNRAAFEEHLQHEVAASGREAPPSLLLVDLDGFKQVNDTLGHLAGDEVLVQVSRQLEGAVRRGDVVARLGGDEFAVLMPRTARGRALTLARRLLEQVQVDPAAAAGLDVYPGESAAVSPVGLSIGLGWLAEPATGVQLLAAADEAMYEAKRRGGASVQAST